MNVTTSVIRRIRTGVVLAAVFVMASASTSVDAQRRGGGGGRAQVNRNVTRTSVRSDQTVNRNVNVNRDIDRNVNRDVDVNRNIDVNRDIDFDRDIDVDVDYDRWGHPVARGVAAGVAAGVATSIALGTRVAVLPAGCTTIVAGGITYSQCGSTWYQPYYSGATVQYVVVGSPY
jgi:hypothetical protein